MNILFSCDEYPPAKTGGIGAATKVVAENLAARGHKVYVVSGRLDKSLPEEAVINGVTVYRLYLMQEISWLFKDNPLCIHLHNFIKSKGWLSGKAVMEYKRKQDFMEGIIREKSIDVVEVPDYTILSKYYSSFRLLEYPRFSVPSVARVHGSVSFLGYYRTGSIKPMSRANDTAFFNSVDNILSVSSFAGRFVNEVLGVSRQCDVIYNPFTYSSKSEIETERDNIIVFLGKIVKTKGAFNLLEAFNTFAKKYPDYKLIMIGGGDIDCGRKIVNPELLHRVVFTGYLSKREIEEYLRRAAFCVIPSYFENFSMAALEVMGAGNILIYTKETSGPEVIDDGINGFLIDPHNPDSISEKMTFVANHLELLADMRSVAQKSIITRFSEQVIIEKLERYYLEITKKTASYEK